MKRCIISGLVAAFIGGHAVPAGAQTPVVDFLSIAHQIVEYNQLLQQYRVLFCSLQTQQATVAALAHANPTSGNIAPGLQSPQMQLPGSAAAVMPNLVGGTNLTPAGQQFYSANSLYTPQGSDFAATELLRQQTSTANIQGEAQTGMTLIAQRIASLTQLQNSIGTQPDVNAIAAVNSQINAEHLYISNEANRLANLQLMASMQQQVGQQRAQQNDRRQAEQWGASAAAQAGWGNTQ